jgi:transposase
VSFGLNDKVKIVFKITGYYEDHLLKELFNRKISVYIMNLYYLRNFEKYS